MSGQSWRKTLRHIWGGIIGQPAESHEMESAAVTLPQISSRQQVAPSPTKAGQSSATEAHAQPNYYLNIQRLSQLLGPGCRQLQAISFYEAVKSSSKGAITLERVLEIIPTLPSNQVTASQIVEAFNRSKLRSAPIIPRDRSTENSTVPIVTSALSNAPVAAQPGQTTSVDKSLPEAHLPPTLDTRQVTNLRPSRINWTDSPGPISSSISVSSVPQIIVPVYQPPTRPAKKDSESLIDWGGLPSSGSPDLKGLIGVEDAYAHTPLVAGEKIAYCTFDRVAYHLRTWQFLVEVNQGRCCACYRTDTIQMFTLPSVVLSPAVATPATESTWYNTKQEIIGLNQIYKHLGHAVVVEAYVHEVYETMNTGSYFVRFEPRYHGDPPFAGFKVVIRKRYASAWDKLGLSPKMYARHTIRVNGVIQFHEQWEHEILVNSPDMIRIVDQHPQRSI